MTVLSAQSIKRLCEHHGMIRPFFADKIVTEGRSYGLSGASYDVRLAQTMWLWPFWGRLASTIEHFNIPDNVAAEVKDKSSNARRFVLVQNTWVDPGFRGYLTLELTRLLPWPVRLKAGTPICQFVFSWLDETTTRPYRGKYQDQLAGAQPAIHEKS